MYRSVRIALLAIALLLCLAFRPGADAQLNFSTGWGKRSQRVITVPEWAAAADRTECATPPTRPPLEHLLTVYNVIQTEARRMLACRKLMNE